MNLIILDDTPFDDAKPIRHLTASFINNKRLLLSYSVRIDKVELKKFILEQLDIFANKPDLCRVGVSNACTYVVIELDMIYSIKNYTIFDTRLGQAVVSVPKSNDNWESCVRFLGKTEGNSDLLTYNVVREWEKHILTLMNQPSLIVLDGYWDSNVWIKGSTSIPVNVVHDSSCGDKTRFIKSLIINHPQLIVSICGTAAEDITYLVSDTPYDGKIIVIQLNDLSEDDTQVFHMIDLVANGILGKIIGLWVFTTWLPSDNVKYKVWKI